MITDTSIVAVLLLCRYTLFHIINPQSIIYTLKHDFKYILKICIIGPGCGGVGRCTPQLPSAPIVTFSAGSILHCCTRGRTREAQPYMLRHGSVWRGPVYRGLVSLKQQCWMGLDLEPKVGPPWEL